MDITANYSLPPQNIDAEEAILGGILLDPNALDRIVNQLHPEAFYVSAHRQIYKAALTLHQAGQPTDLMTVTTWLSDQRILERVGGTSKLAQLVDRTVSAVNIDRYAELVMNKYLRRQLLAAGHEIVELGYDTSIELESVLDQSEQKVFHLANQRLGSNTEPNSQIALAAFNELEAGSPIYPTGLYDLDKLLFGFEPGTLTILAGRPSMGKSAIALFLALQILSKHQLPVLIFSLEMTKKQLEYRLWSLLSVHDSYRHLTFTPIRSERLRQHRSQLQSLSNKELESLYPILGIASELPLYINDSRGISLAGIASESRQVKAKHGKLGLVIMDYLQMMASETGGNRSYELGDVARGLYKMAADVDVPVLALSQISRAVEGRQNKRPTMADLSQSGILEMVADNIILAYRDDYYNPDTSDQGILELILAKARHGDTGTTKVLFDKSYGLLKSLT
jgi:replicative DNA helicase